MTQPHHITVHHYSAWVYVESKHGTALEFVLHDTAERNGFTNYEEALWADIKAEFKDDPDISAPQETQGYGHISFQVMAPTAAALEATFPRCEAVVKRWKAKYHVERMTRGGKGKL